MRGWSHVPHGFRITNFFSSNLFWFSFPLPLGMRKKTTNIFILVNFKFKKKNEDNALRICWLNWSLTVTRQQLPCTAQWKCLLLKKSEHQHFLNTVKNTANAYFITSYCEQCLPVEMMCRLWMSSSQFSILLQHEMDISQIPCSPYNCVYFNYSLLPSTVNESHIILCCCHYSSVLPHILISST